MSLIDRQNVQKGSRVLDAACGTGDIAIALCKYGFYVDAVDFSSDMLIIAKEKTHNLGLTINYLKQDIRDIKSNHKYQAITCVNDGVNYLNDLIDVERFVRSANSHMDAGDVLIFDISTEHKLKGMDGEMYAEEVDDMAYIWMNTYDDEKRCLTMDISFFTHQEGSLYEKTTELHVQKAHKVDEITRVLIESGFEIKGIYDELSFDEYSDVSDRVHFAACKVRDV